MNKKNEKCKCEDEQKVVELAEKEVGEMLAESEASYIEETEGRSVGKAERADMVNRHVEFAVSRYHHMREEKELKPFLVLRDEISAEHLTDFKRVLEEAKNEEDIQKFLSEHSILLIQHLGGGHGRYVLPKHKLGSELIPDFLIAEMSSIGLEWYGVELESCHAKMFTMTGQPSQIVTHAIQQVVEWRAWLESNLAYARSTKDNDGLGLIGIKPDLPSTILIGRRDREFPARFNAFRHQIKSTQNIEIHTYDWLVEQAESRLESLERRKRKKHRR